MNWKSSLKLSSGWAWGIVGFVISTIISWLAPFGQIPRRHIEQAYERFELKLARQGLMRSLNIAGLEFAALLDYPKNMVDFKGSVVFENCLATDLTIKKVSLLINDQPTTIRLWQPEPSRLDPEQRAEYVFYTSPIERAADGNYTLQMEVLDSTDRLTSATTTR
jgi:hypothetical protein